MNIHKYVSETLVFIMYYIVCHNIYFFYICFL